MLLITAGAEPAKHVRSPNVCLQAETGHLHGEAHHIGRQHRPPGDLLQPHGQHLHSVGTGTAQVHRQLML